MQALKPVDFAQVVAQDLHDVTGYDACATPIPEDLGASLPLIVVWNLGGQRVGLTVDRAALSVDVYASTPAAAFDCCSEVAAALAALEGHTGTAVQWYEIDLTRLPYDNPDPLRPTEPRATFAADVYAHPALIEF